MIPYNTVTAWGVTHPWPTREQVEQDLLLSMVLCEIFNDDFLQDELLFRGGTALHKLLLPEPYRYSEDLDFVRTTAGGIGHIIGRMADIGRGIGFSVNTKLSKYPKVIFKCTAETGVSLRIKLEINTFERSPVLPISNVSHRILTEWYEGATAVPIFQTEEIAATKLRALYQRSKGRDLFDLWLLITRLQIDSAITRQAFVAYRPDGYTQRKAIDGLSAKLANTAFRTDIDNLIANRPADYDIDKAGLLIEDELLQA